MNTSQPGKRVRILELVHLELPNTRISTGRSVAIEALIDTRADVNCMSRQGVAEALGIKPQADALRIRITGAGGITPAVTLPGLTSKYQKVHTASGLPYASSGNNQHDFGSRYPIGSGGSNHV